MVFNIRLISFGHRQGNKKKLVGSINALMKTDKVTSIIGEYKPGYLYGNAKIHKKDVPLRPIFSQYPTPTYNLAKFLNKLIAPCCQSKYSIKSSSEFIDLINSCPERGHIGSLDVESLFTNVPILSTIEIICDSKFKIVLEPPPIEPKVLRSS